MKIFILSSTGTSLQSNNHRLRLLKTILDIKFAFSDQHHLSGGERRVSLTFPLRLDWWWATVTVGIPLARSTHIQTRDTLRHTQLSHKDTHIYIFVRDWLKVSRILISKMQSYLGKASPDLSIGVIRMQRLDGMLILHWKIFQKLRAQYYWE